MSDDTDSNVVHLPTRGSDSGGMPDAPDGGDFFYSEPSDSGSGVVPPESPAETTMELPPIRGPISPEMALRQTGMPSAPDSGDGEYEEGEYVQPRSLADRLGDWLEYRLEAARDRHAGEAPFREAEIARKAALLEARTAQETAMMEQNAKLHAAQMKAKGDKASARGKADAARSSSSGIGADKGGRSKAGGGGGGSSGSSGRGTGGGRGSGTNGSGGGPGRGSGGGTSPKGDRKGSDRSAGGRRGGSKGNESSGGSKGRQNGSGGSGAGKSGAGKGSSGGSGSGKGGSRGDGGKTQDAPASSPRSEKVRGRQERAAARQAARQQRRSTKQAADLADRSKDRDQDRAGRQTAKDERRAAKAERKAARKATREAAKAADDRTTLGAAVTQAAQRRWDKRRADADPSEKAKPAKDKKADKSTDTDGLAPDKPDASAGKPDAKNAPAPKDDPAKGDRAPDDTVIDPHKPGERPWKTRPETDGTDGTPTVKKEDTEEPTADKAAGPASGADLKPDMDSKSAKADDSKDTNTTKPAPDAASDGRQREAPAGERDEKPKKNADESSDGARREETAAAGEESNGPKTEHTGRWGGGQEESRWSGDGAQRDDSLLGDYQPRRKAAQQPPDPWVYERVREMLYGKRGRKKKDKKGKPGRGKKHEQARPQEPQSMRRARPEDLKVTVDRPGGPARSPKPEPAEEEIWDAVIVDDAADPFGAHVSSRASLPRAPEPHTQRPGTSRPTEQEDSVASEVRKPTSGQTGMAARHRTDITFSEYLMEIVNIAISAALDKNRAQELAVALGKVAGALRDMAADLINDHNIEADLVNQVIGLADAADRMKQLAERCARECEIAAEAAQIAATSVGRVYSADIQAMDDAGLAQASAAAHHN
ncbi:ATP/GTP-binding protein [Streptomyces chartreusis]|uniref:ATP/GTP-binding protein n=1 Tax=Streptomyces chartreusis TaxID=1969 RepID=UPI003644C466